VGAIRIGAKQLSACSTEPCTPFPGARFGSAPEGAGSGPGRPRRRARDAGREARLSRRRRGHPWRDGYRNCYHSCASASHLARVGLRPARRRARHLHTCRSRALGADRLSGGWGIRTPEGFHPTRFPSASTGGGECSLACVAAGQRCARMIRTTPGSGWIGKNCYQNCYRSASRVLSSSGVIHAPLWIMRWQLAQSSTRSVSRVSTAPLA